jgi:hypothetical protein
MRLGLRGAGAELQIAFRAPTLRAMHLARLALPFLVLLFCGFAKKPKLTVRFHVEALGNAGGKFTAPCRFHFPERQGFIEAVPFASDRNIQAIYPVRHADGSLGCAFQLDASGRLGLETISSDRRGSSMVVFMATKQGTHQVIDLVLDKPIRDGIIYVPRGISPGEMALLEKQFPVMKPQTSAKPE